MAKRRRLNAPSAEELAKIAEGFAAEPASGKRRAGLGPNVPPIAQVAGEAAEASAAEVTEARVKAAKFESDARKYVEATEGGLLAINIPLDAIAVDHLSRDRMTADDVEMAELRHSIQVHGLRMPIEVLELENDEGPAYGLISGWRRLSAMRALAVETGEGAFDRIAALVRRPKEASDAYVSMVEENEIRADLSHYERGRIAVVATAQGAFETIEVAVDELFAAGSKAKRSKIRSFSFIFEELGDLLAYPTQMSERAGLRLAAALKAGKGHHFRNVLSDSGAENFDQEWKLIEGPLKDHEADSKQKSRKEPASKRYRHGVIELANGIKVEKINGDGHIDIRFTGKQADNVLVDTVMLEIQRLLEPN